MATAEEKALPEGFVPVNEEHCRVCGWTDGGLIWVDGYGTHDVCPCCGCEAGLTDMGWPGDGRALESVRSYRGYWVGHGAVWDRPYRRPRGWDLVEQLASIPPHWR
ncbi:MULTISPECIES: hypothetical protein [Streptomyces]|uniref:Uncharacterized protein n=1 Tax=Streptomyces tsukubensis (strain DSM 42081 / NBRC 108919 / NRRL 18488 / 9993) TaxID=1114943 RepID=I2N8W9_STRT9|nr:MULTISPECIES: hypothetical protein [Streptomyces]AZK97327.1 hypothetical protein B7R87_28175 [Streptomyces tsukubensis]EIF93466.1 hypothetical protein [Streptomyces tsukubensis NRRL18488]MYS67223.1 hypothetical protein [Streptomyces sp. SID5473]QKM66713.1 hypothetical protein STSU_005595 [Streptomyces tsukubensis NRRL18488]TAI44940.1 hypothetical protein EWI31_06635 [Streptomyces tsukubensis]